MKKVVASNSYVLQKPHLLRDFDIMAKRIRKVILSHYARDMAKTMIKETRDEYEAIIPQIPYIGGKQPFTQFIIATAQFLALYRVLKKHNLAIEDAGNLIYEICQELIASYPRFILRLVGHNNFSNKHLKELKKRAVESQTHHYPQDYVFTFVEGDGEEFDYGIDYAECAGWEFLKQQEAPELAPYLCVIDILYSETFGWGLVRTMTLAEGYEKCDFRFKKGGKTRVTSSIAKTL
jgi:hypothetical protein